MSIPTVIQPVGWFAQFILDCATSAATVIDPTYVFIGHYEWFAHQNFYQELERQNPAWQIFIGSPSGAGDCETFEGEIQAIAELFYTIPADEPSSLVPLMTQLAALNVAWSQHFLAWPQGGNRNPKRIVWGEPHIRRHEKPFVVSTRITLITEYVLPQASLPPFNPIVAGN